MNKLPVLACMALLAACGSNDREVGSADNSKVGVDRANADIRAAEAATRAPVVVNRSVGELSGAGGKQAAAE